MQCIYIYILYTIYHFLLSFFVLSYCWWFGLIFLFNCGLFACLQWAWVFYKQEKSRLVLVVIDTGDKNYEIYVESDFDIMKTLFK